MTNLIHALEFGFGIVLVVAIVVLIIWGLAALDKAFPKALITIPKPLNDNPHLIVGALVGIMVAIVVGAICAATLGAISHPGSGTSHVTQPPPRFEEWNAAKHFIQAQYPGVQTFSSSDESMVLVDTNGTCAVIIAVGGVNGFNAPIRDKLTVIMKFQGGTFGLQRIDSQNEADLVQQQIKDGL